MNIEFDAWLGNKFEEEKHEIVQDSRFHHDIPLQRSVSLDRGIDIVNYLQTIGSDWSGSSIGSTWTVDYDGRESVVEQYRSFEDIPASPYKAKSRRASSDFDSSFGRSLALSMLRDSYKGMDMGSGSLSPQIKKLKWSFSFTNSFDEFKDSKDVQELRPEEKMGTKTRTLRRSHSTESSRSSESNLYFYKKIRSGRQSLLIKRKNLSLRSSYDDFKDVKTDEEDNESDTFRPYFKDISITSWKDDEDDDPEMLEMKDLPVVDEQIRKDSNNFIGSDNKLQGKVDNVETRTTFYRRMSSESAKTNEEEFQNKSLRVRKIGMPKHMPFVGMKKFEMNLRKEVLIKQNLSKFHSCEDILAGNQKLRRRSTEINTVPGLAVLKDSYKLDYSNNMQRLKRSFSQSVRAVPMFVYTNADRAHQASVAKSNYVNPTNTSNIVDVSRNCDCRICTEENDEEDRTSLIRRILRKLFMKIISCKQYGRKLTHWDENNNHLNENEMYICIMHVLKLMLGLWLRHLDHN